MTELTSFLKNSLKRLSLSFTKESGLAGFFFFLVLCSWYILRPVRNEMAVQNSDILPYLLAVGALVMLLLNPIYSWLASRRNLRGVLVGCYLFFILNLLIFIILWEFFNLSSAIWLSQTFYIWCNVYSFFVVSLFWVVIINLYRDSRKRSFYGVIMAGGSLGAIFGSEISKRFSGSFDELGLELFSLSAALFLFLAMLLALYMLSISNNNQTIDTDNAGGGSFDAIKNSLQIYEVRNIASYVWIWTALMTIQWITAINIVEDWSQNSEQRLRFFAIMEQVISPLTLIIQLFFTNLIIKNTDSLLSLIDDVDFKLDNFIRETERNFRNVNNDLEDLSDEFRTNSRRTKQKLADLEQARDQLTKDLKEVRALPSIIKGIQKMKEEAAKAAQE